MIRHSSTDFRQKGEGGLTAPSFSNHIKKNICLMETLNYFEMCALRRAVSVSIESNRRLRSAVGAEGSLPGYLDSEIAQLSKVEKTLDRAIDRILVNPGKRIVVGYAKS